MVSYLFLDVETILLGILKLKNW